MITDKDRWVIKKMQKYWKWVVPVFVFVIFLLLFGGVVHIYLMQIVARNFGTSASDVLGVGLSPPSPYRTYEGYKVFVHLCFLYAIYWLTLALFSTMLLWVSGGERRLILRLWHHIRELESTSRQVRPD